MPSDRVERRGDLSPFIAKLDLELAKTYCPTDDHVSAQLLVYRVRAAAVRERVERFALGRALLHLAKRRGFNSNLRGAPKDDEETGEVKPAIRSLSNDLTAANMTLGEYLASLNPFEKRIRKRWTGREMFLAEFDRIVETQSVFHPELTEAVCKRLRRAIFFQRPLKSAKGLVGKCSLERKKRRLAAAHPLAQEVRMLQFVNNVIVRRRGHVDRPLDESERSKAIRALSDCGRMTLKDFRTAIELPRGASLNFQGDDDDHACGTGTTSALRGILGDRWDALSSADGERLFYEVHSFNKRDALIRRAREYWGCSAEQGIALAELTFEQGYARHSKTALEKLREHLSKKRTETGRWPTYPEAKLLAYPDAHASGEAFERLPAVVESLPQITSPSVKRALTEVRKVLNELIRRFGKPHKVRVELARELKKSKKERKKADDFGKQRAADRRRALSKIREEFTGYPEKRGYDRGVEIVLLAEECNFTCPYTGEKVTNVRDLIGDNSRFDIEHIYPRRYLDDSFANKTICLHEENRHVKRDQLPAMAYSDNPERYQEILDRVKKFKGRLASVKLARFMAREVPRDFSSRQLNETRYASAAAADYLGLLFGGRVDASGRQRIRTLTGGLTAILRGHWRLNQILSLIDEKNRADHRQHAIDAIVIACTDTATVAALQTAASEGWRQGNHRSFPPIDPPWAELLDDARRAVLSIIVSNRHDRRLNGTLHAGSNYAPPAAGERNSKIRKCLSKLSANEITSDAIVCQAIRRIVQAKFEELKSLHGATKTPKDVFASPENHPHLNNHDGSTTPIHSVRIRIKGKPFAARGGDHTRFVTAAPGSNFCSRILAVLDAAGNEIGWTDDPMTRIEAMRTQLSTSNDPRERFVLFAGDHLLLPNNDGEWRVCRVQSISKSDIEVRPHADGRTDDEIKKAKERIRIRADALSRRCFRKVHVSPTGLISDPATGEFIDLRSLEKFNGPKQTSRNRRSLEK